MSLLNSSPRYVPVVQVAVFVFEAGRVDAQKQHFFLAVCYERFYAKLEFLFVHFRPLCKLYIFSISFNVVQSSGDLSDLKFSKRGKRIAYPDSYLGDFCSSSYPISNTTFGFTAAIFPSSPIMSGFSVFVSSSSCSSVKPLAILPVLTSFPLSRAASITDENHLALRPSPHSAPTTTRSRGSSISLTFSQYPTRLPG